MSTQSPQDPFEGLVRRKRRRAPVVTPAPEDMTGPLPGGFVPADPELPPSLPARRPALGDSVGAWDDLPWPTAADDNPESGSGDLAASNEPTARDGLVPQTSGAGHAASEYDTAGFGRHLAESQHPLLPHDERFTDRVRDVPVATLGRTQPTHGAAAAAAHISGARAGSAAAASLRKRRRSSVSGARWALEWLVVLVGAVAIALLIKAFAFQAFRIPSDSMVPTLIKEDRVLVSKQSYTFGEIDRGDVVVFHRPPHWQETGGAAPKELIKRVIGLPGETIDAVDGKVRVDGKEIDESEYLDKSVKTEIAEPIKVPKGEVLLLGDNRGDSTDGRFFGTVSTKIIVGRAVARIWPPERVGGL